MADVLERDQSLREEQDAHLGLREEHADACARRARIEARIETLKRRRSQLERQHDVLECREGGNQVKGLKHEADVLPAQSRAARIWAYAS